MASAIARARVVTKKLTRSECFARFGAVCTNPRWSWSARSPDGKTVVVTMWQDEIKGSGGTLVYESRPRLREKKRHGAIERLENLKWARDHCEGLVRVVIAIAKDVTADPRTAIDWFPKEGMFMRITQLDEQTGAFRAESVPQP
jgi:hypothetical protein